MADGAALAESLVKCSLRGTSANALADRDVAPQHPDAIGPLDIAELSEEEDDEDGVGPLRTASPSPHGSFLRNAARSGACVAVWHGAIPLQSAWRALEEDAAHVVAQTFWIDKDAVPRCSLERVALGILRFHAARLPSASPPCLGAEFWVQVRSSGGSPTIALHWDSDETHKASSGEHIPPWLATVTYLGSHGAPTVVLPAAADAHGRAVRAGTDQCAFISQPLPGKHLAFDGRLLHGALHELGAPDTAPYVRSTLLVNLWLSHRPSGCERLPEALLGLLSDLQEPLVQLEVAEPVEAVERSPACAALLSDLRGEAGSVALSSIDGGAKRSAGAAADTSRELRVGYTPLRRLRELTPDWRRIGALVGFPFMHPDIRVRRLPWRQAGPCPPSLVRLRAVGLSLPVVGGDPRFSAAADSAVTNPDSGVTNPDSYDAAAEEVLEMALRELSSNGGDWRAARELRRWVPRLRERLPREDDDSDESDERRDERRDERGCDEDRPAGGGGGGNPGGDLGGDLGGNLGGMPPPRIRGEPALLYLTSAGMRACALCFLCGHSRAAASAAAAATAAAAAAARDRVGTGSRRTGREHLEVNADDVDGFTALHFAANLGQSELIAPLLEAGADVHATTRDVASFGEPGGRTPLHLAAASGHWPIVRALLAAGADPLREDWQGATPALLAYRRGHTSLATTIAKHGARYGMADAAAHAVPVAKVAEAPMPSEQELRGFELVESISIRTRSRQRLAIESRPPLHVPFTLAMVLSEAACVGLIAASEKEALRRGWQSTRHRHYPTVDLPVYDLSPRTYQGIKQLLDGIVLPRMQSEYATGPLRVKEAFIVKYEAPEAAPETAPDASEATSEASSRGPDGACAMAGRPARPRQAGLGMHRDGTLLNCVILLSDPSDFEGGGTTFAPPLDATYHTGRGDCLCSCGQLLHGAKPVTSGLRYVMIAFIDEVQEEPSAWAEAEAVDEEEQATPNAPVALPAAPAASVALLPAPVAPVAPVATVAPVAPVAPLVAANSPFLMLTPEEAKERGFRDDEELVMPMPVDSSDEED